MVGLFIIILLFVFVGLFLFVFKLSWVFGIEVLIFVVLLIFVFGSLFWFFGGEFNLFVGMFMIGFVIVVGNVILLSLIKKEFLFKLGLMIGVYFILMNLCVVIVVGLMVLIVMNNCFSWYGSMVFWVIFGIVVLVIWFL